MTLIHILPKGIHKTPRDPGHRGRKGGGGVLLPEGANVASARIALGRARGHSYDGVTAPLAGSAQADINININITKRSHSKLRTPVVTRGSNVCVVDAVGLINYT